MRRVVARPVPLALRRGRPRRTPAGASCRRGRRLRRAAAARRSRSARGRAPRRGPSRTSCGSPAVSKRSLTASVLPASGPVPGSPGSTRVMNALNGSSLTGRARRTRSRPSRPATARRGTSTSVDAGRVEPKTSCRTGLMSGRSSMSVRKTVTLTTSSKPQPPAARIARMFSKTWRVWATTSSPPTSRPSPSTATIPETWRKPPARTASVKCEIGSARPSTRISSRLTALPSAARSASRAG